MKFPNHVTGDGWRVTGTGRAENFGSRHASRVTRRGFTMIEIAICLAIIGFALVAIIGVLPLGLNTQRDTREETVINQDATVLLGAIRDAARGADYLTNYVYAITNYWTHYDDKGGVIKAGTDGFTYSAATFDGVANNYYSLTNGVNIIGRLSVPEFTDGVRPVPSLSFGGYSNHITAYVRSLSGLAADRPPQNNDLMLGDSFGYRVLCVNAPLAVDTNLFYLYPQWQTQAYNKGDKVFYNWSYWQAAANTLAADIPGQAALWAKVPFYPLELGVNQRELRLTFLWPQLPNGNLGNGRQTFRTTVAGQLVPQFNNIQSVYFYQPQFTNAP